MELYVQKNGKFLRRGYTTGTCAAAAAKAAVSMLFSGQLVADVVEVALPMGEKVTLQVANSELVEGTARCHIVKDAGDDPDVTDKAQICAAARRTGSGIIIKGGEGIGIVTKPGLRVDVGEPAINPVPRKMIFEGIKEVLPDGESVEVTIYVPEGEELAKRTMNEKLGIVGGISIIGTTGIVEPRSKEAFMASLVPQIDIALAKGYDEVVLTPGRIGERNALARGVPEDAIIQIGNFVGFMLDECVKKGVKNVLLFGHLSKLTKVAAGFFDTHSKVADARIETIAAHASSSGADKNIVEHIVSANTAEHAMEILRENGLLGVFDSIAREAGAMASVHVDGQMGIGVALISLNGELVGRYNIEVCKWGKFLS